MGIAPTGKPVISSGVNGGRIAGGKIAEERVESNGLGMLQQLGVAPALA